MKWSDRTTVFAVGFFSLAAQTLLFRDFLEVFEGNELGVGCFFSSWLVWVAAGALLARSLPVRFLRSGAFPWLPFLYLPAFVLQKHLVLSIRSIANVPVYEVFPYFKMIGGAFAVNAPVSVVTGFLFTTACAMGSARSPGSSVSRVYFIECLGSFAAGALVTAGLGLKMTGEALFFVSAAVPLFAPVVRSMEQRRFPVYGVFLWVLVLSLSLKWSPLWTEQLNRTRWRTLLPGHRHSGMFLTSHARYLYGRYGAQFLVLSNGGVCEALPRDEASSEIAAAHLAQNPTAKNVLVVGHSSLSIARQFLKLPQIDSITLMHPDPGYLPALLKHLPSGMDLPLERVRIPQGDVRTVLRKRENTFDLIVVHLPDPDTAVLNRYFTREFFELAAMALRDDGVFGVRVSGGENFLGSELVAMGSSIDRTLNTVFPHTALKPGEDTWFFASKSPVLSETPRTLQNRLQSVSDIESVFPPEAVPTLFPEDRIRFQRSAYRELTPPLNTDDRPHVHLLGLFIAGKKSSGFPAWILNKAISGVTPFFLLSLVLYGIFRFFYLVSAPRGGARRGFSLDGAFMVLLTGALALSVQIILMFVFQTRFGSLFFHVGLIAALFMLGVFLGSVLMHQCLERWPKNPETLIFPFLIAHFVFLLNAYPLAMNIPQRAFAPLFLASGVLGGAYFPFAAFRLRNAGVSSTKTGSSLETIDHLGGALGGILTGLFFLPVHGAAFSISIWIAGVIVLFLIEIGRAGLPLTREHPAYRFRVRRAGYSLLYLLCLFALFQALFMRPENRTAAASVSPGAEKGTFRINTKRWAPDLSGFQGPLVLELTVNEQGTLLDLRVAEHNESPAYMDSTRNWQKTLIGKNLFTQNLEREVDTVTGATFTSRAILKILNVTGKRLRASLDQNRKRDTPIEPAPALHPGAEGGGRLHWTRGAALGLLFFLALCLRVRPGRRARILYLLGTTAVLGCWMNFQYSLESTVLLWDLKFPEPGFTPAFCLTAGVPLSVLLLGNWYCGYFCPFGACQELAGELRPRRLQYIDPRKETWRWTRLLKYGFFFVLAAYWIRTRDPSVLRADPLAVFFSASPQETFFLFACALIAASFFYRRFFCRNLCPASAFLSFLNEIALLKRIMPRIAPGRCDLGVQNSKELDCIRCDRCRTQ